MTPAAFTLLFLSLLLLTTLARLLLASRHLRHVKQHRDAVPHAFSERISLSAHQHAADYTHSKVRLDMFETLFEAAVLIALTVLGGIQFLLEFWQGLLDSPLLQGGILIVSVLLLSGLLEIPFGLYRTFVIEQRFGFNKTTWKLYWTDMLRGLLLGGILGLPLLFGVLWLMDAMGAAWWLYTWLAWMGFNLLVLFIYPTFIAPLFNRFTPLPDGAMRNRIEALLAQCGFTASGLFVMDGSRRSAHGNAYFTGFGRNKRIVFFDTLLARLDAGEIEAVLAHELGHFKRRHVHKRMLTTFAGSLLLLYFLGQLLQTGWFFAGLGVTTPATAAGLLLFILLLPLVGFWLHPLLSAYSRKHEYEADAYAAQHARRDALVSALVKLYQDNAATLTPDPWYSAFYDSHPPAQLRIAHLHALKETPP